MTTHERGLRRLTRSARLTGALLLTVSFGVAGVAADAAVIPDAITDVRIEETRIDRWHQFKLHLDWSVPDGSQAGDMFTLGLPAELEATDGTRFALRAPEGQVVANAVIDGDVVTFTLTPYAQTHDGVHGAAWFWVRFAPGVEYGDELDLEFRVENTVFRDSVTVTGTPGNTDNVATKWQTWVTGPDGHRIDRLLWAIDGPVVRDDMVNQTYTIVDTPGAGQEIDCDTVDVFTGLVSNGQ